MPAVTVMNGNLMLFLFTELTFNFFSESKAMILKNALTLY